MHTTLYQKQKENKRLYKHACRSLFGNLDDNVDCLPLWTSYLCPIKTTVDGPKSAYNFYGFICLGEYYKTISPVILKDLLIHKKLGPYSMS